MSDRTKIVRVFATQNDGYRRYGLVFSRKGLLVAVGDALKKPPKGCQAIMTMKDFADLAKYATSKNAPIGYEDPDALDRAVVEKREERAELEQQVKDLELRRAGLMKELAELERVTSV